MEGIMNLVHKLTHYDRQSLSDLFKKKQFRENFV